VRLPEGLKHEGYDHVGEGLGVDTWVTGSNLTKAGKSSDKISHIIGISTDGSGLFNSYKKTQLAIEYAGRIGSLKPYGYKNFYDPTKNVEAIWLNPKDIKIERWSRNIGTIGDIYSIWESSNGVFDNPRSPQNWADLFFSGVGLTPYAGDFVSLHYSAGVSEVEQIQDNIMNNRCPLNNIYCPTLGETTYYFWW
jgi:hypothetical protein